MKKEGPALLKGRFIMRIQLGVIGPSDSVELVKKAAEHFDTIDVLPFVYKKLEETVALIEENKHRVDQWFFSGQAPYHYALAKGIIEEKEGSYAPVNGISLYKTLLEAQVKENKIFSTMSLDSIQDDELKDIGETIPTFQLYTLPYTGYLPPEDLIDFHVQLYREGKTEVAITFIQEVYFELKALGIPCYRVTPGIPSIRLMLQYLKEHGLSQWYKKAQTAILGITVFDSTSSSDESFYTYKRRQQELELQRILIHYAELVHGSFQQIGDDHFYIYTTRGEMDLHFGDNSLHQLIEDTKLHSNLQINIGLGYGLTALEAEQNVRLAFRFARRYDKPVIIQVNEDKTVTESLQTNEQVSYNGRTLGDQWKETLKNANISPAVVGKIQSFAQHYKKKTVTALEVSQWLKGTERNARRILTELEKLNLAEVTGEEQSGYRGRPRKIYALKL